MDMKSRNKRKQEICREKNRRLTERFPWYDPLLPPRKQLREEIIRQRMIRPLRLLVLPLLIPNLLQPPLLLRIRKLPSGKRHDLAILSVQYNTYCSSLMIQYDRFSHPLSSSTTLVTLSSYVMPSAIRFR